MDMTVETLEEIERESGTAPVTLLRRRIHQLHRRPTGVSREVDEYAGALLLKLVHLLREQCVDDGEAEGAPAYLAPWMAPGYSEVAAA